MATPPVSDNVLEQTYQCYISCGMNQSKAASELGISRGSLQERIKKAERKGFHLSPGGREAMNLTSLSGVEIAGGYRHVYDDEGRKTETVRWNAPKAEIALETVLDRVGEAFSSIPSVKASKAPRHINSDLCTMYAIADAHVGLRAWHRETGQDYDTDIAASRVSEWVAQCVDASPPADTAIIADIGDYTHANDDTYQTPRSKHVLDVDTRMFRTLDIGIAALASAVENALRKHKTVHVCILPGNHDSTIYLAVMFALVERYRHEPRVVVRKEPSEFFMFEFGKVMIAAHHGDKSGADRMVHFVADQFAEAWGRTKHRFLYTGHLHHHKSQDIGGMKWEQLRAVAEKDAFAFNNAYSARAQLSSITYHRERGETQRTYIGL